MTSQPTFAVIPPQSQSYGNPFQQQQQQQPRQQQSVVPSSKRKKKKYLEDSVLLTRLPDDESEDGRLRNSEAIGYIREAWIGKQIRQRQAEFTTYRTATCFVGTWNVNAKGKEEPLDDWLQVRKWRNAPPDVIAVGFQEIVDLNAVNVAVDNKTQQRSSFWIERLRYTLAGSGESYEMLATKSMVGLLLVVFCRQSHIQRVRYVSSDSVGVGVLGMGGNKGGVCIRLQFYDTTICLVCSHLAAHRENVTGRNADFANIWQKTMFDIGPDAIKHIARNGSLNHFIMGSSTVSVAEHDIVFWLGDLNYRIDESMATEKVLELSEKAQLEELRSLDQLNVERAAGRVFADFEEGVLNFVPTYKYQPGTDVYEQRPDKKLRAPAWCDRILWYATEDPAHVQQLVYDRSETPNVSDHKPVYALFRMVVKDVMIPKREAIYKELMQMLDRYENQTLPVIGLDRVALDFGAVRYEESLTLPIQITNTGSVVAHYRLVPKPDEREACKPWLSVSPMFGMIIPGDPPVTMQVTMSIQKEWARMLNSGREVLEDILILRLENGRDYYITVKATFARSCFGMSVDELVLYSDPIREVPLDPLERAKKYESMPPTALCVPKELWRLIDAIYEKGMGEPHLFVEQGNEQEVKMIRESLDTGKPFPQCQIHSYAEVLTSFLSSLSSPIIPMALLPPADIDSNNIQMSSRRLLEDLSPIHYNVFVYVISFFREVLNLREQNKLSAAKLARICVDCMAPETGLDGSNAASVKRRGLLMIVMHLLETSSI